MNTLNKLKLCIQHPTSEQKLTKNKKKIEEKIVE
jgi:hypothetical protein